MDTYHLTRIQNILIIQFDSEPDLATLQNCFDHVNKSYPALDRIWDFSKTKVNLSTDELRTMSEYVKNKQIEGLKIAYVTPDDLSFGIGRNYESFRAEDHVKTYVARELDEAMKWISG